MPRTTTSSSHTRSFLRRLTRSAVVGSALLGTLAATAPAASAVSPGDTPTSQVADAVLRLGLDQAYCSGVMISPSWALTAHHCVDRVTTVPVSVGVARDQGQYLAQGFVHPDADLALIRLNDTHDGVCATLPASSTLPGERLDIIGFGGTRGRAQQGEILTEGVRYRYNAHVVSGGSGDDYSFDAHTTIGHMVEGDSGGPSLRDEEVAGIFSRGNLTNYTVMVDVAHYSDWIEEVSGVTTGGTSTSCADIPDNGPGNASYGSLILEPSSLASSLSSK